MTKMYPQFQSLRAKPLCADYRNYLVAQNASDCGGRLKVFEPSHILRVCSLLFCVGLMRDKTKIRIYRPYSI